MKKYLIIFLFFTAFIFLSLPNPSEALICGVRAACNANETCLFSMTRQNNSHVGDCDQGDYKACCDQITSATLRVGSCNAGEGGVISMFRSWNAHAANANYYDNKVCAKYPSNPVGVVIRNSPTCLANETCVASIFRDENAHVGQCGYYDYQICLGKYPDLYVNSSSITTNNSNPSVGDVILFNVTIWNIGDATATNVNISAYDNQTTYITSNSTSSIAADPSGNSPVYSSVTWKSQCGVSHNITVEVDGNRSILELNETNNNATKAINLTEYLYISIISPTNTSYYRGQTVNLQSNVSASCNSPSGHTVTWYNQSQTISTSDNTTWTIPLDDGLLGAKTINATMTKNGYNNGSANINITVLNNVPTITGPSFNKSEIQRGEAVQISCDITDTEDGAAALTTTVNVKASNGTWSNVTASRIGDTFYRDYSTSIGNPLGTYTAACKVTDTDDGSNETSATFLVYSNFTTFTVELNDTSPSWGEGMRVSGLVLRDDGSAIDTSTDPTSNVEIYVNTTSKGTNETNSSGHYLHDFNAPNAVGKYIVNVTVDDPLTSKTFSNYTTFNVKPEIGAPTAREEEAETISCYEEPRIMQNPDGTIKVSIVRICVWK